MSIIAFANSGSFPVHPDKIAPLYRFSGSTELSYPATCTEKTLTLGLTFFL